MGRASVILDFVFDDGLMFVSLTNIGDGPALDVAVEFAEPIHAAEGLELGKLALFRRLAFLGPGRTVTAFVDSTAAYFGRREPEKIAATIRWREPEREDACSTTIRHDLGIYRDLPFIPGRPRR